MRVLYTLIGVVGMLLTCSDAGSSSTNALQEKVSKRISPMQNDLDNKRFLRTHKTPEGADDEEERVTIDLITKFKEASNITLVNKLLENKISFKTLYDVGMSADDLYKVLGLKNAVNRKRGFDTAMDTTQHQLWQNYVQFLKNQLPKFN